MRQEMARKVGGGYAPSSARHSVWQPEQNRFGRDRYCASRRITLVLDLKSIHQRLKARDNWVYRNLTAHWPMHSTAAWRRKAR
jgi:hypothetical protein